jgi:hypothetical protein
MIRVQKSSLTCPTRPWAKAGKYALNITNVTGYFETTLEVDLEGTVGEFMASIRQRTGVADESHLVLHCLPFALVSLRQAVEITRYKTKSLFRWDGLLQYYAFGMWVPAGVSLLFLVYLLVDHSRLVFL